MQTFLTQKPYHLKQCGLSYVYLWDGYTLKETNGKPTIHIKFMKELYKELAEHVVYKPEKLNGEELAFLLKYINKSDGIFCQQFYIRPVELQKWKKRKEEALMPFTTEIAVRMWFQEQMCCFRSITDVMEDIHLSMRQPYYKPEVVFLQRIKTGWEIAEDLLK